ncbi:MAG: hypothetical protein NT157_04680 [Candidatus Micrarchaeota archaeon]|nr:hypothetical protein [Candidatus Micrarchaeota archaeon]
MLIDEINEAEGKAQKIAEKAKKEAEAMLSSARDEDFSAIVSAAREESNKLTERAGRGAEAERLRLVSSYKPLQRISPRAMDRAVSLLVESVLQSMRKI